MLLVPTPPWTPSWLLYLPSSTSPRHNSPSPFNSRPKQSSQLFDHTLLNATHVSWSIPFSPPFWVNNLLLSEFFIYPYRRYVTSVDHNSNSGTILQCWTLQFLPSLSQHTHFDLTCTRILSPFFKSGFFLVLFPKNAKKKPSRWAPPQDFMAIQFICAPFFVFFPSNNVNSQLAPW